MYRGNLWFRRRDNVMRITISCYCKFCYQNVYHQDKILEPYEKHGLEIKDGDKITTGTVAKVLTIALTHLSEKNHNGDFVAKDSKILGGILWEHIGYTLMRNKPYRLLNGSNGGVYYDDNRWARTLGKILKPYEERGLQKIKYGDKITVDTVTAVLKIALKHLKEQNQPSTLKAISVMAINRYSNTHTHNLPLPNILKELLINYRYLSHSYEKKYKGEFVDRDSKRLGGILWEHIGYTLTEVKY